MILKTNKMKMLFKWIFEFFNKDKCCPNCKTELTVYSRDAEGHLIYYSCKECKYEVNGCD